MDKVFKWNWAIELLQEKGEHKITEIFDDAVNVDGRTHTFPELYKLVSKYPEWQDRCHQYIEWLKRQSTKS